MNQKRIGALVAVVALVVAAGAPAAVAASEESLSVTASQDDSGDVTVAVAANGTAVANASVAVDAGNDSYAGSGNYTTDANGTVALPAPNETVTVDVTAEEGNVTGSTTVELVAPSDSLAVDVSEGTDGATVTVGQYGDAVANASVEVTATNNTTYAGEGNYTTDANGTVALPAPNGTVTVDVTASSDGLTASTTATLGDEGSWEGAGNFGTEVTRYVSQLQEQNPDGPLGQLVSDFVVANNPGSEHRPDHAGPNGDRGPGGDDEDRGESNADERTDNGKSNAKKGNDRGNGSDRGNGPDTRSGGPDTKGNGHDKDKGNPHDDADDGNEDDEESDE